MAQTEQLGSKGAAAGIKRLLAALQGGSHMSCAAHALLSLDLSAPKAMEDAAFSVFEHAVLNAGSADLVARLLAALSTAGTEPTTHICLLVVHFCQQAFGISPDEGGHRL